MSNSAVRWGAVVILGMLPGCVPAPPGATGAHPEAIYWGEPEDGYPGVVQLEISLSVTEGALCSGTLVAPRVVVTAEHCVEDAEGGPLDPGDITVRTGPSGTLDTYDVAEIRSLATIRLSGADIAVLVTEEPVLADPYAYATEWEPVPGEPITLVGYGQREDAGAGEKYRGDNQLDYVFETYFTTTGEPGCHGDSGGPAFDADGVLVGVIVNTLGGWVGEDTCLSGVSGLTRVDAFHELVDGAVDDTWDCDGVEEETCADERDNDCDRLIDEGCLELGAVCASDDACGSGQCRDLGEGPRCTAGCTPGEAEGCPAGFYCDEAACAEGACVSGTPGDGAPGDTCVRDTDCRNLSCIDTGEGLSCLQPCGQSADCATGEACTDADGDGCGGCWPEGDGAPFGATCADGEDCASGACVADAFGGVCSVPCGDGCPAGSTCDPDGQCVRPSPTDQPVGAPCTEDAQCASESCEDVSGAAVCTGPCTDGGCPDGLACVDDRCVPDGAVVGEGCAGSDDCAGGLCGNFGDFRACTAACDEDAPCAAGLVCDVTDAGGYCRPRAAPPARAADEGCGCRLGTEQATPRLAWLACVLAFWLRRSRRR